MDELKSSSGDKVVNNNKLCIEAYRSYLLEQLEPHTCRDIAVTLQLDGIFTKEQESLIEKCEDQVAGRTFLKALLDCIDKQSCYTSFLEALNHFGLSYVVNTLTDDHTEHFWIDRAWEQSLKKSYHEFINNFKPKRLLLRFGRNLLGDKECQDVRAQATDHEMCHKLLYYLRKRPELFPKFIHILKNPICGDLSKWVTLLDPEDDLQGLKFVNLIHACYPALSNELEPDDILDDLTEIPESLRDLVRIKPTREERLKTFVTVLTMRPPGWFKHFINALSQCKRNDYTKLIGLFSSSDSTQTSSFEENKVPDEHSIDAVTTTVHVTGEAVGEHDLKCAPPCSSNLSEYSNNDEKRNDEKNNLDGPEKHDGKVAGETGGQEDFSSAHPTNVPAFGEPQVEDLKSTVPAPVNLTVAQPQSPRNNNLNDLDISEKHENEEKENTEKEDTASGKPSVVLRSYQQELAQQALTGQNCMIVAPTGSGKTFVALYICMEHIKNTRNAKVVFLVPRVPLVQQQYNLFSKFLPDDPNIIFQITGESSSSVPVHISIRRHVVTIMTAQILMNLLSDEIMTIDEITLLIIDECHHTVKNDPYNMIMRVYLDEKLKEKELPQVVGLTASPGMGKAKTMAKAHENIKTLMANLDITTAPVQVNETVENLLQFQHETQDEVIAVPRRDNDSFSISIKKAMKEIQDCIKEDISRWENALEGRIAFDLRAAPGSQDYEAWAVNLLNKSKLIKDETASQFFMAYAIHLREYNTALMLNDHVRSLDALTYISDTLFQHKPKNEVEKKMQRIYVRHAPNTSNDTNPMLERLTLCFCKEFTAKEHSRCIIFVKTRAIAKALLTYLDVNEDLRPHKLNPMQLTGAGARVDNFGMTKTGQEDTLKDFKAGLCKVIVATSVAEEGLDIKECNLIVTYNYSTNEIGQVQRKGRGRAKDSKVIMLAYADSGHVKRERENSIRVELTQDILSNIRSMDSPVLISQIRKIQETLKKDREFDRTVKMIKQKQKRPNDEVYKLSCIWCKRPVTTSDQLRHINYQHRVVTDVNFANKAWFKEVPEGNEGKRIGDEQFVIGKIYCKNKECSREWGLRMRYKGWPISVPRIANFLLTDGKSYRAVKKQWKDAPFVVDKELTVEDLQRLAEINPSTSHHKQPAEDVDYNFSFGK